MPKSVLVDPRGGLDAEGGRLSFVDENVLETVLLAGQAEWRGLGDRRALLVSVRDALERGVEQVNLCPPEGVTDELFSYAGSGTLFTEGDYTRVGRLALDEFEQILKGKKLLPYWRGKKTTDRGINLRRVFTEPRTFDPILWVQGTAATPYLEKGTLTKFTNGRFQEQLNGRFGGYGLIGFGLWFN